MRNVAAPGIATEPDNVQSCGLLCRFLVMLYDTIVIMALLMFATALALLLPLGNFTAGKDPVYTLYLFLVWFLYLAWCWRHGGMTLGMRVWKVVLLTESGRPADWRLCFVRFAGSLLSALPLGAGFAWSIFDEQQRAWHDRLSRSRLVRIRAAPRPG